MSPIAGREAVELKSDLSDWHPTKSKQANERNLAKRIFDSSYHVTSPVKARPVTKPVAKRRNACDKLQVSQTGDLRPEHIAHLVPSAKKVALSCVIIRKDVCIINTCGVYNVDCQR